MSELKMLAPDWSVSLWDLIEETRIAAGMTESQLAEKLGPLNVRLLEVCKDSLGLHIGEHTARQLEHLFNVPASFWIHVHSNHLNWLRMNHFGHPPKAIRQ